MKASLVRKLRSVAALGATAVAGYFSLATSCLHSIHELETELSLEFAEHDAFKLVRVRALSGSVSLGFDQPVRVPVFAQGSDEEPGEIQLGGAGNLGGDTSMPNPNPTANDFPEPIEGDPEGECVLLSGDFATSCNLVSSAPPAYNDEGEREPLDMVVRVFRADQTGSFALKVLGQVTASSCDGDPPDRWAIRLEEVTQ